MSANGSSTCASAWCSLEIVLYLLRRQYWVSGSALSEDRTDTRGLFLPVLYKSCLHLPSCWARRDICYVCSLFFIPECNQTNHYSMWLVFILLSFWQNILCLQLYFVPIYYYYYMHRLDHLTFLTVLRLCVTWPALPTGQCHLQKCRKAPWKSSKNEKKKKDCIGARQKKNASVGHIMG